MLLKLLFFLCVCVIVFFSTDFIKESYYYYYYYYYYSLQLLLFCRECMCAVWFPGFVSPSIYGYKLVYRTDSVKMWQNSPQNIHGIRIFSTVYARIRTSMRSV